MTDTKMLADLILSHRDHFGTYHHHKERMAYGAMALYLAAAAFVASQAKKVLEWTVPRDALITLLILSAVAGFAFVWWQLRLRAIASDIVSACITVATELASRQNDTVSSDEVTPTNYSEHSISFPKILVDTLCLQNQNRKLLDSPRISEMITYAVMLAWSIAALISLCRAA